MFLPKSFLTHARYLVEANGRVRAVRPCAKIRIVPTGSRPHRLILSRLAVRRPLSRLKSTVDMSSVRAERPRIDCVRLLLGGGAEQGGGAGHHDLRRCGIFGPRGCAVSPPSSITASSSEAMRWVATPDEAEQRRRSPTSPRRRCTTWNLRISARSVSEKV